MFFSRPFRLLASRYLSRVCHLVMLPAKTDDVVVVNPPPIILAEWNNVVGVDIHAVVNRFRVIQIANAALT